MTEAGILGGMEKLEMPRRTFLTGLAAVGATVATGVNAEAPETSRFPTPRPAESLAPETSLRLEVRPEEESEEEFYEHVAQNFTNFDTLVMEQAGDYVHELERAVRFAILQTQGDPKGRTRVEYLRTALQLNEFHPVAAQELRKQLPAKAMVEANWEAGLESSSGARGILQFMPGTWEEHGEGGNILSLVDQVVATDNLLEQVRRTLMQGQNQAALDRIEAGFFNGDHEAFIRDFYVPCVQSCFNAGAGNLGTVLRAFAQEFSRADDIYRKLDAHDLSVTGKDVYALMIQLERFKDWDPQYGAQSMNYVTKIYAARAAIDEGWSDGMRAQFMGELPDGTHPMVDATESVRNQSGVPPYPRE